MDLNSMKDLYLCELRNLHYTEQRFAETLDRMAEHASHGDLTNMLRANAEKSRHNSRDLGRLLADLGESPRRECVCAIDALAEECQEVMEAGGDDETIDAAMIAAANRIDHYTIALYGAARSHSDNLGLPEHTEPLKRMLDQMARRDEAITHLAERINPQAVAA